jgi:tRNA (cytidine56-2'-O)-methyltransferase
MGKWKVGVLRLDHRHVRDDRTTTHVFLTARAFGASEIIYSGQRDEKLEERIKKITKIWGGSFNVKYERYWKRAIVKWKEEKGELIHLTFYGLPIQDVIDEIRNSRRDKIIVVGGAKVPRLIYEEADWNVSITSQPHSEISALSIFLHELFEGKELTKVFNKAKLKIIPQPKGKKILKTS